MNEVIKASAGRISEEIAKKYPDEYHLYYSAQRLAQEWYDAESEGV